MNIAARLDQLGLTLPSSPAPAAHYLPWRAANKTIYLAGQTPKEGSVLKYQGQIGRDLTVAQGYDAATLCTMRLLSALQDAVGDLDHVERVVKVTVFVNAAPDFTQHAQVANGASDLLCALFPDAGQHARSAVGASALPGNAAVEIEMIAQRV